jgi:MerR family mercuric resistance operon transcriptional regulator
MKAMTIRHLADSAGVHVETVRYYQRRGLLREPERPMGGIRHYDPTDASRLQFIRRAQTMGFTLDEIAELAQLSGRGACAHTRELTELKLVDVRRKIAALRRLERDLTRLAKDCAKSPADACCPTLDRLDSTKSSFALRPGCVRNKDDDNAT